MHDDPHSDPFDQGLLHDLEVLQTFTQRRRFLRWAGGLGVLSLLGCGGNDESASGAAGQGGAGVGAAGASANAGAGASGSGATDCSKIPEETGGPYPGDGTNGPNALSASGIVRDDITQSFGTLSGTAEGVPLTIQLTVVSSAASCKPLSGYAVYLWHCDRDGHYSMYTAPNQNYLRGVQETDENGTVTFESIFPACYSGRWPHIHFEIFESLELATQTSGKVATSQLALPEAACDEVYATTGYEASISNLRQVTLASDMVFADGATTQTPSVTGSVSDGYVASLTIGVNS